jgi:ABC-2 type transport system permease protein
MSLPFLLTVLGIGLFISTKARTQAEAFQLSMGTVLPSVFLSGYIFLLETMSPFFRGVSRIVPATYYIQILRGIILRGAGFRDLWLNALVLTLMGCATVLLAARQFVKQRGR